MPSTTVHIPEDLLFEIDKLVKEKKTSRNRFIIEACRNALKNQEGKWPKNFFDERLCSEDLALLTEAGFEMESAILNSRANRTKKVDL
jgi:Arc/MetJ-type ribon-helix-helix transcriptional regulator